MTLPLSITLAILLGLAASLAGRSELRVSPRPVLYTKAFVSLVLYTALVLIPASVYFYVFHGDWFLLYLVDVQQIPSAVALVGFVGQLGLGALGFLVGALLVRNQHEAWVGAAIGLVLVAGVAGTVVYSDRLAKVGSYAQFHGQFGLRELGSDSLLTGILTMSGLAVVGAAFLLARLYWSGRRA